MEMRIFDKEVSIYPNYGTPESDKTVTLNTWLSSEKYKEKILEIRSCEDKETRGGLKYQLPCITPSGVFSRREDKALLKHSGFLQVDLDPGENPEMVPEIWKNYVMDLGACMCQLSASGRGIWGLFRISNPEKHRGHFLALKEVFLYDGMKIDEKCGNLSRLRGISYDENTLYNPDAEVFTGLKEERKDRLISGLIMKRPDNYSNTDNIKYCISEITRRGIDITSWYSDWFAIACAFSNEFGEAGREYFHEISQFYTGYDYEKTDRQYTHCLKSNRTGYTIATFAQKCKENGILYKEKKT